MAKNDKQKLFDTSYGAVKQAGTDYGKVGAEESSRGTETWNRASNDYAGAAKGYQDYAAGGGLTQADKDRMQAAVNQYGSSGGGGGGVSNPLAGMQSNWAGASSAYGSAYRPDYGEADTGYRKLASDTGGMDKEKLNQIHGNVDTLTGIGKTGGITDEDKSNINRASILEQEKTGGYTDQDKAMIRAKSATSAPAYFGALKDNMERQRSQTGNLAGAGAVDFKMARNAAQQQAQDRVGTEIGMADSIRAGKQQAGDFLSGKNLDLASLRTGNQLQGAQAAAQQGLNTQQGITGNQATGLSGLASSQTNLGQWGLGQAGGLDQFGGQRNNALDQWNMNNAQMDMSAQSANSSARAAGDRAGAEANMEYQKWLTEYGNQQKQYGIGGLEGLYGTNLGASQQYSGMQTSNLNNMSDSQSAMLGHATANRGTTAMENMQTIGNVAGGVIGAATGMGGIGSLAGLGGGLIPGNQQLSRSLPGTNVPLR